MKSQLMQFNKFFFGLLLSVLCVFTTLQNTKAQIPPAPNPPRLVNDFADLLNAAQERNLENKLVAYDDSTSTQIAVVTVESLNGDAPYNFAHEILEKWGLGEKGKDNGIVVLVSVQDRKATISTGYGVEATLTDALCQQIIGQYMVPAFKQGDFYGGVDRSSDAIIWVMSGQYDNNRPSGSNSDAEALILFLVFFFIFFFLIPYLNRHTHDDDDDDDTFGNGKKRRKIKSRGGFGPIIITGGGGFSGGGGGFSGGGFGGFGGGLGGGGGATGSW